MVVMDYSKVHVSELKKISNQIRQESIRMTYTASSGHPGGSLSEADILAALYFNVLRIDPNNPQMPDRDRLLISKGHACPGWYAALALRGYFPVEELSTFRQINSRLQGHPDMKKTPGVEMTAGPLGNGLAGGAGIALGARIQKKDFHTFVLIGEGDFQEGCTWEAIMFSGFHKLSNLTCIFDYNDSQVDGSTHEILDVIPIKEKWLAFNWDFREIDGHDMVQILEALAWAKDSTEKPTIILARTTKGKGVSFMENQAAWHGKAPNKEQADQALKELEEAQL
jgi:transketolase